MKLNFTRSYFLQKQPAARQCAIWLGLFLCLCINNTTIAQTITTKESRCVNTGEINIAGTVGAGGPYQLSLTSYPAAYTPGAIHSTASLPDAFAALFPGSYTLQVIDQNGAQFTYPNITVGGSYVLPGNNDYNPTTTAVTNCASPNGIIQGALTHGRAPYTYTIASGPAQVGTANATGTFSNLPAGVYQVQAADSCQNIQTRNVTVANNVQGLTLSNASISLTNCTTYSLNSLTVSPSLPAGSHYEIIDNNPTNSSGQAVAPDTVRSTSLPITFSVHQSHDIQNGTVKINVVDACGNIFSIQPRTVSNDWSITSATITASCAGGVVLAGIITTGTIPGPYTMTVTGTGISAQNVPSLPYTISGANATTNPLKIYTYVSDACGVSHPALTDLSFTISTSNFKFNNDCSTAKLTVTPAGAYNSPVTYTLSPDPGVGSNTTGNFTNIPDGSYTITATDACGKIATYNLNNAISHGWELSLSSGNGCSAGTYLHTINIPGKAIGTVTFTQYAGSAPVTASSTVLSSQTVTAPGIPSTDISGAYSYVFFNNTLPGQTYTYVATDACGFSDTVTRTNGNTGHQPLTHNTWIKNKCINKGDLMANWYNDGVYNNYISIQIWNQNTPGTLLLNTATGTTSNLTTYPSGQALLTDLAPANYVVKYTVGNCGETYNDTVVVSNYVQPSISALQSFVPCSRSDMPVIVSASGGVAPYTYALVTTTPNNYSYPSQTSPVFTLPTSQTTGTVRVLDACLNSSTRTVAITKASAPVIRVNTGTLATCTYPYSFRLFIDSVYDGSVFAWTKITGAGAGSTVISHRPYLPVTYNSITDTATYKVTVTVPNTCYNVSSTFDVTDVATTCSPVISGNVFNDANGATDGIVNGTGTNAGGLFAVLVDANHNVVASTPIAENGAYNFTNMSTGTYSIVLSTTTGSTGSSARSSSLPSSWMNTGENNGVRAGSDGTVNGILTNITVGASNITNLNFGIEIPPVAKDTAAPSQQNPGGTVKVQVPTLNGTDFEDGTYDGVSGINTVIIQTLPNNGTLYYNNVAVTAGQTIQNYNPSLLTADPNDGTLTMVFTYSESDAAGVASTPATVKMPFVLNSSLPVQLLSFTAAAEGINTRLSWQTTTEINTAQFIIEYKNGYNDYTAISQVQAKGTSNQLLSYTWLHMAPAAGNNYYRLRMIDNDGHFNYSDVKMLTIGKTGNQVKLYPNPVIKQATITGIRNATAITICDLQGRPVLSEKNTGSDNMTINVTGFAEGIYLVLITEKDGTISTVQKFVKQ